MYIKCIVPCIYKKCIIYINCIYIYILIIIYIKRGRERERETNIFGLVLKLALYKTCGRTSLVLTGIQEAQLTSRSIQKWLLGTHPAVGNKHAQFGTHPPNERWTHNPDSSQGHPVFLRNAKGIREGVFWYADLAESDLSVLACISRETWNTSPKLCDPNPVRPASPWVPPKGPKTKGPWNALVWRQGPSGKWHSHLLGGLMSNHTGTKHKTGSKWFQVKRVWPTLHPKITI